jgi:putative toxin-antitoxin system antitoxin component (TIGR02293 family)
MQPARTVQDLEQAVRKGLPFSVLQSVVATFGLDGRLVAAILHLSPRTLSRRKADRRLSPEESDRLVRMVRVMTRARSVLGGEAGMAWLHTANRALGGRAPLTLLDTDLGAIQVEQVLGRIEHGVFS